MTSYPSNAINVNPIAAMIPVIPSGTKSTKLIVQSGLLNIIQIPNPINTNIKQSWTIVTITPTLPVSDVPLILRYVKATIDNTAINLSTGRNPNKE